MKTISIFGCGWLGKALAKSLENNYIIKASVRSQSSFDLLAMDQKFLLNEENDFFSEEFYKTDILIIAIPPRQKYLQTLKKVISYYDKNIILCSSTSVYKDVKSPMREAEVLLSNALILRFAGLMGYDRVAGKYSAGKTIEYDSYVNYIHRDDCVEIIKRFIEQKIQTGIYNIVARLHPTKKEVYDTNALRFGFDKTEFKSEEIIGQKISSKKLIDILDYHFLKENPMEFWT